MSRLDYVTIAIVGICILAIMFLVYKMTNVFGGEPKTDNTEMSADSVEAEDDTVYDYEIDEAIDSSSTTSGTQGNGTTDRTTTSKPATTSVPADKSETSASETDAEDDLADAGKSSTGKNSSTKPSGTTSTDDDIQASASKGKFMVLAGSFKQMASAEAQLKKLKKLGYDNARIEPFNRGAYAVVLVDRFGNMADAEKLVKELSGDGIKSYVKTK